MDTVEARALAACRAGDVANLARLLREFPWLIHSPLDDHGRLLLHIAVLADDVRVCKYLIGRWSADAHSPTALAKDVTPLSLCRSRSMLLLLLHGAPRPADKHIVLASLRAAAVAADAATHGHHDASYVHGHDCRRDSSVAAAVQDPGSWVHKPDERELAHLVCFLPHAPSRRPPRRNAPPAWPRRIGWLPACLICMPFILLLLGCLEPRPMALMLLIGVPLSLCVVTPSDWVKFSRLPEAAPMAALLLVVPIVQVIATHHVLLLAPAATSSPLLLTFTVSLEVAVLASYARLLASDGGFIAGGEPEDARRYWEAIEHADERNLPSADHFDPQAEAVRPPRARFSRMAGGLVREMDHDCPWIGAPVGEGNHRPFIALLAFGGACAA